MRRLLAPVPLAVLGVLIALVALLAYGLATNEPDRGIDDAVARGVSASLRRKLVLPRAVRRGPRAHSADYRGQVGVLNFWASGASPAATVAHPPALARRL